MKRLVAALSLAIGLAGCGGSPPQTFAPLNYSYLPPITLQVATVNVVNSYAIDPGAAQLMAEDPAPPPAVLGTELARRLIASGAPGTATVTIEDASVEETNGTLNGAMTVRVDVASADGQRTGFTEAAVSHSEAAPDDDSNMPAALYDMTKQLMDAMNVQLQYHVQHDLSAWVVYTPNAFGAAGIGAAPGVPPADAGGVISAAPLAAPPATGAPSTGAPSAPGAPQSLTPSGVTPPVAPLPVTPLPGQTLQLPPSYAAPSAAPPAPSYIAPPAPPPLPAAPLSSSPTAPQNLVPY